MANELMCQQRDCVRRADYRYTPPGRSIEIGVCQEHLNRVLSDANKLGIGLHVHQVRPAKPVHRHDMALDLDGRPLPIAPADVRKRAMQMFDEGELLAVIVKQGDDVSVQVMGPPSAALVELLQQAVDGLRKATRGHG